MVKIDLGFCWIFASPLTPEAVLRRLRLCGFDGIELWPAPLWQYGVERWARAFREEGMRCLQLCPYFNFVDGPGAVDESRAMLGQFREAAHALDCRCLRVFTGRPWGQGVVGANQATAAQWKSAINGLRECCNFAPEIEFCLECHEGSLMEDSPSALRLIHGVDRPNLTTNLQLPLLHEDWQTSVEKLGPHSTHIHIHNWLENVGSGPLTFLGEGVFDWPRVLDILVNQYHRPLCLSVEHPDHGGVDDLWETARRDGVTLQVWRDCLKNKKKHTLSVL